MQTAVTALRVLDKVAHHQPVGVSQLAKLMDMPKSTMQRALRALEAAGWIRPSGTLQHGWVLTTKPIDMARRVAADTGLRDAARPVMVALRDATTESVHLAVREGHEVVIIDVEETSSPVRIHWPAGMRSPAHATANGKAMLAYLEPGEVLQILDEAQLQSFTASTITDRDLLLDQLAMVRTLGFATAKGELREDICSVAAPIRGRNGSAIASISVFAPASRMPEEGALGLQVRAAADTISTAINNGRL